MNLDELTWFNQQLAAMLREGLPLSGSLRQLTSHQARGRLRDEMVRVESALAAGQPLEVAVAGGRLPPLYVRLVQAGIRSGDLPSALTLAADHYADLNDVWRRAKALLVYPAMVAVVGLAVSLVVMQVQAITVTTFSGFFGNASPAQLGGSSLQVPLLIGLVCVATFACLGIPWLRSRLLWRLPGFREARTAQVAGGIALMLRHGCPLPEALGLMRELEDGSPAARDLSGWLARIERGESDPWGDPSTWSTVPRTLAWFVRTAGGDLAAGFARAARFHQERARNRLDMLLHGAMPVLLLGLASLITTQALSIVRLMVQLVSVLGDA